MCSHFLFELWSVGQFLFPVSVTLTKIVGHCLADLGRIQLTALGNCPHVGTEVVKSSPCSEQNPE